MAVIKSFSAYTKILEVDTDWMIQIDLTNQNVQEVVAVFTKPTGVNEVNTFTISEDIETSFAEHAGVDSTGYFQFKNNLLHISCTGGFVSFADDSFWFTAKRIIEPIESLEDTIDIPDSLVPLFVNKVLSNLYHLQGKETPLTIKRRIKELE